MQLAAGRCAMVRWRLACGLLHGPGYVYKQSAIVAVSVVCMNAGCIMLPASPCGHLVLTITDSAAAALPSDALR